MATKDLINLGTAPDTGTGDSARKGGEKINTIFVDTYTTLGDNPVDTDQTSASYGQRTSFGDTEFKVGELHPAGKWNKLNANANSLTSFNAERGDQIIIDLDGFTPDTFNIVLPHAIPGDVIKFRDGFGNWSNSKKVEFKTSALNPDATSSQVNTPVPFIYDPSNTLGNGPQGALNTGGDALVFTSTDSFALPFAEITSSIISINKTEVNTILYNSSNTQHNPADDPSNLDTELVFNLGLFGNDTIDFRSDAVITLQITSATVGTGPINIANTALPRSTQDIADNIVRVPVSAIQAVASDYNPIDPSDAANVAFGDGDSFTFTVVTPPSFTDKTTLTDTNGITRIDDDTVAISISILSAFSDIGTVNGLADDDDEFKIGDTFTLSVSRNDATWNLLGDVTIGHVNINGTSYSNEAVTATAGTNDYTANITAASTGYIVDDTFADIEFFYQSHTDGWRSTVTQVNRPVSTGTVIFEDPFYNTIAYSGTTEETVIATQSGTALDLSVTNFSDATSDSRHSSCNTIIVDENWILNGTSNGVILQDPKTGDSSDQWTIYLALPQSETNWDAILGKKFSIVNNSLLPVVVKPLVFDFTNSTTVTDVQNNSADYVEGSLGSTPVTRVFNGLTGNKAWTLENYAFVDGDRSTNNVDSRLNIQYPGLTSSSTNKLTGTPLDLEKRFDESINTITFAFTADNNSVTTTTGLPSEGREHGWRVIATEQRNLSRKAREFRVVTGQTEADAAQNARGGIITPGQAEPTYLFTALATDTGSGSTPQGHSSPTYQFVNAGDASNNVDYIITGLDTADPYSAENIEYSSLEVYKNGILLEEGNDWRALVTSQQTGTPINYKELIDVTTVIYAFDPNEVTRSQEVDAIEFQTSLTNDDVIEIQWFPATILPDSLEATISTIVQNNVSTITNQITDLNEHQITFAGTDNVLAQLNLPSTDSFWQNNEVTNNGNLNPTGGWYFEVPQTAHGISATPHVTAHETITTAPGELPGFTTPGFIEATVRVHVDGDNTVFVSADQPFTGRVTIYR